MRSALTGLGHGFCFQDSRFSYPPPQALSPTHSALGL
ncbi:unnamed protein product [Gulo gulo]|uniref:Uncharacterized protein n=1 Tax=Gulo gulo TaxID=48420 RepID=A0A9X9LCF4_GULGU|nr:unnamed protein product [Gulo gulo]